MPNSITRIRLPAATTIPDRYAALQLLANKTKKRNNNACGTGPAGISHLLAYPAARPTSAASRHIWGPELPNSIGRGGRTSAEMRNAAIHRSWSRRSQHNTAATRSNATAANFRRNGRIETNPPDTPAQADQTQASRFAAIVIWQQSKRVCDEVFHRVNR